MLRRHVRPIASALLLSPAPAYAADVSLPPPTAISSLYALAPDWGRYYLALQGGVDFLRASSIDYVDGAATSRSLGFNTGWALIGAAGYRAAPWLRVELEGGERRNGVNSISPGSAPSGSTSATTLMANGYVDIPNQGPVTPYFGAGFGKAWLSQSLNVDSAPLTPSGTTWPWAYQFMAGASMPINAQWSVNLEYRYFATQRALFQDVQGLFYNSDYNSQSVLVGVTWRPR
jgi:opacity protein-like surface antigen